MEPRERNWSIGAARFLPIVSWLRGNDRPWFSLDVIAGLTLCGFRAPLMVILLTSVVLQASTELSALIVIAVATVMIVQPLLQAAMAGRQRARAAT